MIALTNNSYSKGLETLLQKKIFSSHYGFNRGIQPASIDIPVGSIAYEMPRFVSPYKRKITDIVAENGAKKIDLTNSTELKRGVHYFIPVGSVKLPDDISARISPKSSVGRVDLHVRSMVDDLGKFDEIPSGYSGQWWFSVIPNSFGGVKIHAGQELAQIMAFDTQGTSRYSIDELSQQVHLLDDAGLSIFPSYSNKEFDMSLAIPKSGPVAFRAKKTDKFVDMTQKSSSLFEDFFEVLEANEDGTFTFEKDEFYIMRTKERIAISDTVSVEMIPSKHNFGELRVHYAGFFDPGFGIDYANGGVASGAHGVLEIRPREDIVLRDGAPICSMVVYENYLPPINPYGKDGKSNYANQLGLKGAKYFTEPRFK